MAEFFGFIKVTVTGINGIGPISAPGLKVGDRLFLSYGPGGAGTGLEPIVTVDDEIQQNSLDWTSFTFDLIFLRGI